MPIRNPKNIIEINKKKFDWRYQLPAVKWSRKNIFFDENNNTINPLYYEIFEQYLIYKWIKPKDVVLEIGGRYGVVSCSINSILENKKNHVVVEPDDSILNALKKNKKNFQAEFKICKNPISNFPLYFTKKGFASNVNKHKNADSQLIKTITFKQFINKYKLNFNVLVLDCEGCMFNLFEENPDLYKILKLIIFEKDNIENCDYEKITSNLILNKFIKVDNLLNDFQQVWTKK